jgi:hypothetical protein
VGKLRLRSVALTLTLRCLQFSQALVTALRFLSNGTDGGRTGGNSFDRGRSGRSGLLSEFEVILTMKVKKGDWLLHSEKCFFLLRVLLKVESHKLSLPQSVLWDVSPRHRWLRNHVVRKLFLAL